MLQVLAFHSSLDFHIQIRTTTKTTRLETQTPRLQIHRLKLFTRQNPFGRSLSTQPQVREQQMRAEFAKLAWLSQEISVRPLTLNIGNESTER
jgi:hypothetical protein